MFTTKSPLFHSMERAYAENASAIVDKYPKVYEDKESVKHAENV